MQENKGRETGTIFFQLKHYEFDFIEWIKAT